MGRTVELVPYIFLSSFMFRPIRSFAKINVRFAEFNAQFANGKDFCKHAKYFAWLEVKG